MFRLLPLSLALVACGSALPPAARQPDGSWHLKCDAGLDRCVQHAETLCKGGSYVVLGGKSERKLYGAELGVSQVEVRKAELDIACANRRGDLPPLVRPNESVAVPALPVGAAPATPVASAPAPAAPVPAAPPVPRPTATTPTAVH